MKNGNIVIIGAGPAGLTAAYELQKAGAKNIIILEADNLVGGISKTINYKGNRIDIGGHRFFSKSQWVMDWWQKILPISKVEDSNILEISYKGGKKKLNILPLKKNIKNSMLVRNRLSRIYFGRQFFDYPLKLNFDTLIKLGPSKVFIFGFSYIYSRFFPVRPERNFEDFLVNRFGYKLYIQFFKEYTEKVWGVPCSKISAEWGAQRIKALSISKALMHAIKKIFKFENQKKVNTSLIEKFIYPRFGPGQMWEAVASINKLNGVEILMESRVEKINITHRKIRSLIYKDKNNKKIEIPASNVISTMPIKELIDASKDYWPKDVIKIASGLEYRDFITVGLLFKDNDLVTELFDNWIYIQEPGVNVGRVQIFNNWSPYMVKDLSTKWLGLEFFCKTTDKLWKMGDEDLKALAQSEIKKIGLVKSEKSIDAVVIRVPKAYPGYFGNAYKKFNILRGALDAVDNLFLIGRNGMHRYNNQDHSMLTAKEASKQIISGQINKELIWNINIDDDYHEEK